jgi:lipid A ethanolaminephosphotransferase
VETLIVCCSLLFSIACNHSFWQAALEQPLAQWRLGISLLLVVTALHAFLMGLMVMRWNAKPLLALLVVATALASHFMTAYGIYLDASMLRNVLQTDSRESAELLTPALLLPLALSAVPVALLWRVRLRRRRPLRALGLRLAFLLVAAVVAMAGALLSFQDLSSLVRNHREVRYLVTPANYLVSLANILGESPPGPAPALLPVGADATRAPPAIGARPRLLVLVVGETARAGNWGLDGYGRDTTPQLSQVDGLINFSDVSACGSSTAVSLPCMFSPYGRSHYDEHAILGHQSLLHVLDHAGIATLWRDNQSGCKGVCTGLPTESLQGSTDPVLCDHRRCLDEILLKDLGQTLAADGRDRVVVLHQLGNHGPSYSERYPSQFRRFTPTCESAELGECDRDSIVNAYDNALLYTDQFLAATIGMLKSQHAYDAAMIYVSDHGESLGEKGLYLHGMPYAIAPREQLQVPMVMWFSPTLVDAAGLDTACLARRARQPASHDNLFPSVLGLMQVRSTVYRAQDDLFAPCRRLP